MYDKERPDCSACIEMKQRQGLKPPCDTCRPKLLPENNVILYVVDKYGDLLSDSMGGISVEGIRLIMDLEKVSVKDRPLFVQKLTAFVTAAIKSSQKEVVQKSEELINYD